MRPALSLLVLSSLLVGCGGEQAATSLVGVYYLDRVAMVATLEQEVGLPRETAEVEASRAHMELTCDRNGNFVLQQRLPDGTPQMLHGTWTAQGSDFRLAVSWRDGKTIEPAQVAAGQLVDGALHLRPFDAAEGTYALVLRRR
jgi:hypothetical protein